MPYPVQQPHEVHFKGPFLHGVYRTLALGGRIVAFVLGVGPVLIGASLQKTAAFFRLPSRNPSKPVLMTPARSILGEMLLATVGHPKSPASASAEPFTRAQEYDKFYHGPDEVNLLEELSVATPSVPLFIKILLT
ncbi:hypothetical protein EDB89DRAFT_2248183 [Lactarius sanguifluus]|nr:hypothetical protein EDB89DRAFT_2248183 [Lactarius sanguifluus]